VLRVEAPECASHAQPGSFVHLTCDLPFPCAAFVDHAWMLKKGWVEDSLIRCWGPGLQALAARKVGEKISNSGTHWAWVSRRIRSGRGRC